MTTYPFSAAGADPLAGLAATDAARIAAAIAATRSAATCTLYAYAWRRCSRMRGASTRDDKIDL